MNDRGRILVGPLPCSALRGVCHCCLLAEASKHLPHDITSLEARLKQPVALPIPAKLAKTQHSGATFGVLKIKHSKSYEVVHLAQKQKKKPRAVALSHAERRCGEAACRCAGPLSASTGAWVKGQGLKLWHQVGDGSLQEFKASSNSAHFVALTQGGPTHSAPESQGPNSKLRALLLQTAEVFGFAWGQPR